MKPLNRDTRTLWYVFLGLGTASLIAVAVVFSMGAPLAARNGARPGTPGAPYANMPAIAPIGVRVTSTSMFPISRRVRPSIPLRATEHRSWARACTCSRMGRISPCS